MPTTLHAVLGELMEAEAEAERLRWQSQWAEARIERLTTRAAKLMRPHDEHTVWDGPDDSRWHLDGDRVLRDPRRDARDVVVPPEVADEPEDLLPDMGSIGPAPPPTPDPPEVFPALRFGHGPGCDCARCSAARLDEMIKRHRDGQHGDRCACDACSRARSGGAAISGGMA